MESLQTNLEDLSEETCRKTSPSPPAPGREGALETENKNKPHSSVSRLGHGNDSWAQLDRATERGGLAKQGTQRDNPGDCGDFPSL
ncbi:hypothetical protein MUG91_G122n23 [Manis pentadactyla]|nr:hypothetical protein MUG91_G122n23 [Manis pentadactyla]